MTIRDSTFLKVAFGYESNVYPFVFFLNHQIKVCHLFADNHFASSPTSSANPKLALHVVTTNNLSTAIPKPPTSPIPIRNGSDQNVMLIDEEYTVLYYHSIIRMDKLLKF